MNAHGAHYVANADAKVQLFSVTAITFMLFFAKRALQRRKNRVIYKQLRTKSPQTTIFSLFLCNFAVAQRLLNYRARNTGHKQKKKQEQLYSSVFCHTEHSEVSLFTTY